MKRKGEHKKVVNACYFIVCCFVASPTFSQAAVGICEPVQVVRIGYVKDLQGKNVVRRDTNLAKFEIVMKSCPKRDATWKLRRYYGFADSISFNKHRYWCVEFADQGANYIFSRNADKFECR